MSERIIGDPVNQAYDIVSTIILILNLVISFALTFDEVSAKIGPELQIVETVTIVFFAVDYVFRIMAAKYTWPGLSTGRAIRKYVFSAMGIVDLLSFLPYCLPFIFPFGASAFRLLRLARIMRLFRINAYYDSMNVIAEVLISKRKQLLSSVFIILILILAASLGMYNAEHEAQPEVFANAFSGIWWASAALLTVGYGDIYPVTILGQILGVIITFLGVGVVAIPTGIISAGFVEQFRKMRKKTENAEEKELNFVSAYVSETDSWNKKTVRELALPAGLLIVAVSRQGRLIAPRPDVRIRMGDEVILAVGSRDEKERLNLKELVLLKDHPWVGMKVEHINISRNTRPIMIKRGEKVLMPRRDLVLRENDRLILSESVEEEDEMD